MVTKKTATSKVTPAAEVKETAAAKETVTVKTAAASKPETKKVEVKEEEKAPAGVQAEAKKEETKAPKKTAARKPAAKKLPLPRRPLLKRQQRETLILQFGGKEILGQDLMARVREIWKSEGNKEDSLADIKVYVKPEESAAYYVINGEITGCISL